MPRAWAIEDASFNGLQRDKPGEAETYLGITAEAGNEAFCAALELIEVVQAHAYCGIGFFVQVVDILSSEEIPGHKHQSEY